MNIEEVREYALSLPGTTEDQAYGEDWVLFRIEGKIFLHIWLNANRDFTVAFATTETMVAKPDLEKVHLLMLISVCIYISTHAHT